MACAVVSSALADEVRVLTSSAFKAALLANAPAIERVTGHRLVVGSDTAGGVVRRMVAGEEADLVIAPPAQLDELAAKGLVRPGSARPIARTGIGVAVREGEPAPDIGTAAAFRAMLLAAPSLAYIDPKAGGSSGVYLDGLFERLGVAEAVRAKSVLSGGGFVAERVAKGEAAVALHQISEILPVAGVRLVGPLPPEIQAYTVYAVALPSGSARAEPGQAVLDALTGPAVAGALAARGMEPAR